ncbi:hypothetical protein Clacol_009936 [Clathrus columnatus]|uniref:mRNA-capping enzyme subunit beta n=1 Tax=Clathrus columnatus TaxID=1419009 RepID=A0AAV5ASL8_9AGAM|nr:hypothetical protein Clacol_009936 [Clathrus columnatus]
MGLKDSPRNPKATDLYGDEIDDEEGSDDDDGDDEDDFLPQRRKYSDDEGAEEIPPKRQRYSPSSSNGYSTKPQPPSKAHDAITSSVPRPLVPSGSKPALEHSILNVEPVDEFIRDVADFVHRLIANRREYVEIEAKIGVLRDSSGQRIRLPVATETILLSDAMPVRFESNMSASQHQHYNGLLNSLGIPPQDSSAIPRTPLKYSHTRLVDTLYPSPDNSHEKLRVTTDEATGKVVQCIKKIRLGDLNVYSPKRNADWRISVNLEVPVPQPAGTPLYSRKKDRLTYTHQYFNIDLTQVHQAMGPNATPVLLHELELEFNNAAMPVLLHAASMRHHASPPDHEFDELMRIFVNNARILVKNANSAWETGR